MKTKYHIFKVYDYKGGELSENINLDLNEFYDKIIEDLFDNYFHQYDKEKDDYVLKQYKNSDEIHQSLLKEYNRKLENHEISIYAGNWSYVAKWYKSEGFTLNELDKIKTLKRLSEYIWNKYYNS